MVVHAQRECTSAWSHKVDGAKRDRLAFRVTPARTYFPTAITAAALEHRTMHSRPLLSEAKPHATECRELEAAALGERYQQRVQVSRDQAVNTLQLRLCHR